MQKNICPYRHGVDNDIIHSFFEVHKKKLRNREDREKNAYNRENGRSYFTIRAYPDVFVIEV